MSSEAESIPSPSCYFSLELTVTIYNKGRCVLCLVLAFGLDFILPVCSQRYSRLLTTSFSIQPEQHNDPPAHWQAVKDASSFLCFKTSICFLKAPTAERVWFISISMASDRHQVVTEQKTTMTSTRPANDSHYSEYPTETYQLLSPPAQLGGTPRGNDTELQVIHKRLFQHPVAPIPQPLNICWGKWKQEVQLFPSYSFYTGDFSASFCLEGSKGIPVAACETPCSDSSQLLINFLFLVPFSGMS